MIYEKILKLVAEQFAEEEESLSRDTNFMEDLNADSLDVVELSMTIEEEFGLGEISEDELRSIETIGDPGRLCREGPRATDGFSGEKTVSQLP